MCFAKFTKRREESLALAAHETGHVVVNLEYGATSVEVRRDWDGFTATPDPLLVDPDALAAGMIAGAVAEIVYADLDPVDLFRRGGLTAIFGASEFGDDDHPIAKLVFDGMLPQFHLAIVERTTEIIRDRMTLLAVQQLAAMMDGLEIGDGTWITERAFADATHSAPAHRM